MKDYVECSCKEYVSCRGQTGRDDSAADDVLLRGSYRKNCCLARCSAASCK
jgi:hypothetical protein